MSALRLLLAVLLLAAGGLTREGVAQTPPGFVGRDGTGFVLDGKPFYVAGVNNHYLTFGSDAEVRRVLDDAVAMGVNVVRTFVQPVIGSHDGAMPTIWNFNSKADASNLGVNGRHLVFWDAKDGRMAVNETETGFPRLDFVIAEAGKRNLRVLIALIDFWSYTGGAQQFRAWYGSQDTYTFFAQDERTRRDYKTLVHYVLNRRNTLTGTTYRDDPTIFAWDLANEPDIHPEPLLRSWLQEMASYVKALDPKHLLTTGHGNMKAKLADLAIPEIDFGTWHGYAAQEKLSQAGFKALIGEFCAIGRTHGKPVLLEEFGLAGADDKRAEAYRDWLSALHDDPGCAGWVVWRLVSRQDSGNYPFDHDGYDVHRGHKLTWEALRQAAAAPRARASRAPLRLPAPKSARP